MKRRARNSSNEIVGNRLAQIFHAGDDRARKAVAPFLPFDILNSFQNLFEFPRKVFARRMLFQRRFDHICHLYLQALAGAMQATFDGRNRHVKKFADLCLRVAINVKERRDNPFMFRQCLNRSHNPVADLFALRVTHRRSRLRRHRARLVNRLEPEPLSPELPVAEFEDKPPKPGRERTRLLQHPQIEIRLHKGFLRGVFGQAEIADQRIRIAYRHSLKFPHNRAERIPIPALRLNNQRFKLLLHDVARSFDSNLTGFRNL